LLQRKASVIAATSTSQDLSATSASLGLKLNDGRLEKRTLKRQLSRVKQTSQLDRAVSAFDPKATWNHELFGSK
jgi:hypothetical protein